MAEFPWSHLFDEIGVERTDELKCKDRQVDQLAKELKDTTQKLTSLREISEKTFEDMKTKHDAPNSELEYTVMINMVLATKEHLEGEEWTNRVLKGVLLWLQQRKNLIAYLRKHESNLDQCKEFEKLLFISKQDILDVVDRLSECTESDTA